MPKVAYYSEVEGTRAIMTRNWLRLLRLVISLAQAQFHIPFHSRRSRLPHYAGISLRLCQKERIGGCARLSGNSIA